MIKIMVWVFIPVALLGSMVVNGKEPVLASASVRPRYVKMGFIRDQDLMGSYYLDYLWVS